MKLRTLLAVTLLPVVFGCGGEEGKPADDATKVKPKPTASAAPTTPPPVDQTAELAKIGARAFVWGYPAVFMERMKRTMTTNVHQPLGTFQHKSKLSTPGDGEVVPNNDTLLSSAWIDLAEDAWVLKVPDMGDRYYAFQMVDAYANVFAHVGRRSTGTKAGSYVITGPGFKGTIPAGAKEIKSPTNTVWLLGHTRVENDADVTKVSALLKQFTLTTLSGKAPSMPPSPEARPQDLAFAGPSFFDELGDVTEKNPPPAGIPDWLSGFAKAGIGPGLKPTKKLEQKDLDALGAGLKDGVAQIDEAFEKLPQKKNGWDVDARFGKADLDPLVRAAFVKRGMDWNVAEEAYFPLTQVDDKDMTLSGAHEYVLHFDKAPPVDAFWSLSLYSKRSGAFAENPLKRYSVNEKMLKKGKDGSLDVYLQADAPKGNEANWLPVPKGEAFFLVLRMYQPKPEVVSGAWALPPVKKIK
jgi:hypothetical protein